MPSYRTVLKSDASTPEAAVEFIRQDTGGVVMHATAFPVIEVDNCWRVPVFSMDGKGHAPLPLAPVFPGKTGLSEAELARQEGLFERPDFKGAGPEGPGWTLGEATGQSHVKTSHWWDEEQVRNPDPDQTGWTPGIPSRN